MRTKDSMKTPKDGWINATQDDLQKASAEILARKQCMRTEPLYQAFNKLGVYLPDVMHKLMAKPMRTNEALMDLLFAGKSDSIKTLIA